MRLRYPCVRQVDRSDCGAAALASVCLYHRLPVALQRMRDLAGTDRAGTNLLGLVEASEKLGFSAKAVKGPYEALPEEDRHITGQQLCLGLRELAIEKYGLLAPVVLEHWRVRRTFDFGRIVFAMIEAGLMTKTHRDSLEDFQGVYDFDEAFSREALVAHIGRN